MLKIYGGSVITNGKIKKTNVYIENGKITDITDTDLPFTESIDATGLYVSPGFIDTHVHGGGGHDFLDGGCEPMRAAAKTHLAHGTTSIAPTSLACPHEDLKSAILDYKKLSLDSGKGGLPNFIGMHLEGPNFSPMQAGAQAPEYIYPPREAEYEELLSIADGAIVKWSFAPELDGALKFCERISSRGILPSIGHSNARYEEVKAAYEHGAKCFTHLYSGMSTITRENGFRVMGVIEAAYLLDDMWAEIIADGAHLPPDLLKMIVKSRGKDKLMLITDAMRGAAMPEGDSILGRLTGGTPCIIEDGVAKMPNRQAFAGSVATADRLVRTFYKNAITSLPEAVALASENPALSLGLHNKGKIQKGYDADIVIFDNDINVSTVLVNGERAAI